MEFRDRDRASTTRMALTIGGIAAAILIALFVGGVLLKAALSTPVVNPAPTNLAPAPKPPVAEESTETSAPAPEPKAEAIRPEPKAESRPAPVPTPAPAPKPSTSGVVVIDAGHQGRGDNSQEPIGPGASETKPKVTSGTSGVATRELESVINLKVAKKLRTQLERRGVKVIMVRESQDVNIANSERAAIANRSDADLFIRIHCDGAGGSSAKGFSTLVPGRNQWTGPIVAESAKAGKIVHRAALSATGASDHGVVPRTDMSGFNWAKVPSIIVEMGFMSNPAEDRALSTSSYQDKLAAGLANGVVEYLGK